MRARVARDAGDVAAELRRYVFCVVTDHVYAMCPNVARAFAFLAFFASHHVAMNRIDRGVVIASATPRARATDGPTARRDG
jgi:hypothetical protein